MPTRRAKPSVMRRAYPDAVARFVAGGDQVARVEAHTDPRLAVRDDRGGGEALEAGQPRVLA